MKLEEIQSHACRELKQFLERTAEDEIHEDRIHMLMLINATGPFK